MGSILPGHLKDVARSQGLVAPDVPLRRARLYGDYPNADHVASGSGGVMRAEARPARSGSDAVAPIPWGRFLDLRKRNYY